MQGFTLLELLVALAIFAILAVMAYRGLEVVLASDRKGQVQAAKLAHLQTLYTIMSRDIEQAIARPIRDQFGDRQAALVGSHNRLELTRSGLRNPANFIRSRLQRLAYLLTEDRIQRLSWRVLDRAQDSTPYRSELFKPVDEMTFRYLDPQGQWHDNWPKNSARKIFDTLPSAIEVKLDLSDFGQITWLFRVPSGIAIKPVKS